ncbi:MAG: DUF2183 domain-containing protein [Fulvivirga sp.]|uniref:App1 family protein n=1 Tax=Fulvivirga sp. TaxID=1931237 RepID=UPI0032ECD98C
MRSRRKQAIKTPVSFITRWIRKILGVLSPPAILAYKGYSNGKQVYVQGHVLFDRALKESQAGDKKRKNFLAMISRYLGKSIANIEVEISFYDIRQKAITDEQGMFKSSFNITEVKDGWHPIRFRVAGGLAYNEEIASSSEVLVANSSSEYIIVSDIDDTVLVSHATKVLRKLRLILLKNSKTRLPFNGVARLYEALQLGKNKATNNPLFYVSSSEWNLYDFLEDFFEVRGIPKGPMKLQELKTSLWKIIFSGGGTHNHKKESIAHLLITFPNQKFILIGDSGQKDAEIYTSIAKEYPGRIEFIYIRDVNKTKKNKKISSATAGLSETELVIVKDSYEAAEHAYQNNLIAHQIKKD